MKNNRKIEVGQVRSFFIEDKEDDWVYVKLIGEESVVCKYFDSFDTDEDCYTYNKDWFLENTILVM